MSTNPPKLQLLACGLLSAGALAQSIPDRATLNSLLPTNSSFEDFESLNGQASGASSIGTATLNAETVIQSSLLATPVGPGLVEYGATYQVPADQLFVIGANFSTGGFTTQALGPGLFTSGRLDILYSPPVTIMGVDIAAGFPFASSGQAVFRDANNAILGAVPFALPNAPTFVGWQSATGIASVELTAQGPFTPSIDNHAYNLDPAQFATRNSIGAGCGRIPAAFYETHASFDLSNTSIELIPTPAGYGVVPGTSPVVPTSAAPTSVGNTFVLSFALGWSFPWSGGTVTTLQVASNGYIGFDPRVSSNISNPVPLLLRQGPILAAKMCDMQPMANGTVTLETDPVAQTATITFDQVQENSDPNLRNTFQYFFDSSGRMELRYGACAATPCLTGWNAAPTLADPGSIDLSAALPIAITGRELQPLLLEASARPVLGAMVDLTLSEIPPSSPFASHVYGLRRLMPPRPVLAAGLPDCLQLITADAFSLTVPSGTTAVNTLVVPNLANLIGTRIYVQGAVLGPIGANGRQGVLLSNGIELLANIL